MSVSPCLRCDWVQSLAAVREVSNSDIKLGHNKLSSWAGEILYQGAQAG